LIVTTFLWSQYHHSHHSSSSSLDDDNNAKLEDKLYDKQSTTDLKEGLAEWEANNNSSSPATCKSTRPRESPGHVTAYLIMVHSEETLLGARELIQQIYDPFDYFLIHADKKLDDHEGLYEKYKTSLNKCSNIDFVPDEERIKIGWGDIVRNFHFIPLSLSLS